MLRAAVPMKTRYLLQTYPGSSMGARAGSLRRKKEDKQRCQKGSMDLFYWPSTCARATSVCGSQKVMSISRYNAMAADRAGCACSRCAVLRYNVPRPRWQCAWSGRR